jgi:hypothetical protein
MTVFEIIIMDFSADTFCVCVLNFNAAETVFVCVLNFKTNFSRHTSLYIL